MNKEQKDALQEYEALKIEIKTAEARLEELKPLIIPIIPPDTILETELGTFALKAKPKWEFTSATQAFEEQVKNMKAEEIANGKAKEVPGTIYVEYRLKKEINSQP